jgi:hypothetical protein
MACSACQAASPTSPASLLEDQGTPVKPSPTPFVRIFDIFPDQPRQVIADVGSGNFIHYFGGTFEATEAHSELDFELLQPRYARVSIELQEWEPQNDNPDPARMDSAGFMDDRHNHATFELMQQLQAQGVELTATVWRVPDWIVKSPNVESPRFIIPGMYPEAIESIAAWLLHARNQYSVEVAFVSFNESNLGVTVYLTPAEYAELIRQGGKRFKELGLKTQWLLGDCSNIGECLKYVKGIYQAEDIHPYLGPLAFHNWDGVSVSNAAIKALGNWAAEQGLDIRCTEGGWDAQLWQRPEEFPAWATARQLAFSYTRTLKMSRATVLYYWEMMGGDYALNDGKQPYQAMEMLMNMKAAFPAGTQIVETSEDGNATTIVAGRQPSGRLVVQIVSNTVAEGTLLRGLPNGDYDIYVSTREQLNHLMHTLTVSDGTARFETPGFSLVLIQQK